MPTKQKTKEYNRTFRLKHREELKKYDIARNKTPRRKEQQKGYDMKRNADPKRREARRGNHIKRSYGVTLEEYNQIFEKQGGLCAICKIHQSMLSKSLFIDHNHETGVIRGLLCSNCNFMLGNAKDSSDILSKGIAYLKSYL